MSDSLKIWGTDYSEVKGFKAKDSQNNQFAYIRPQKNIQVYSGYASRTANSYGATDVTLTVAKTGTYKITWMAWRSSSSDTMGTNLHIDDTAESINHTTWTNTYGQCITLNNQSLTKDQVLTLYATSGNNSQTINVGNLIIEEQ